MAAVICYISCHWVWVLSGCHNLEHKVRGCLLSKLRQNNPTFVISGKSWNEKKILTLTNVLLQVVLFGIGFGQIDINYKLYLEWLMIINTLLYFLTFRLDFQKCKMGVEIDEWATQQRVDHY